MKETLFIKRLEPKIWGRGLDVCLILKEVDGREDVKNPSIKLGISFSKPETFHQPALPDQEFHHCRFDEYISDVLLFLYFLDRHMNV